MIFLLALYAYAPYGMLLEQLVGTEELPPPTFSEKKRQQLHDPSPGQKRND